MTSNKPPPLFLYSLSEFTTLIRWLFSYYKVRSVIEIGAEFGQLTEQLLDDIKSGRLDYMYVVDPAPQQHLKELLNNNESLIESFKLKECTSLAAIPLLPSADCYLIDGDHNYYTVLNELREIEKISGESHRFPLVILHDVGWPCGRRDMYYAPKTIPNDFVHSHDFDLGTVPDTDSLVQGGFRPNGHFAFSSIAGGPRNGVMTAVEDFLSTRPWIEFRAIHAILGLGVFLPSNSNLPSPFSRTEYSTELASLLQRMEKNRIELYLRVLDLQDQLLLKQNELAKLKSGRLRTLMNSFRELISRR